MYVDDFYFSPFEITANVVTIWQGLFVVKDGKLFYQNRETSSDDFYARFVERAQHTWFLNDFISAFGDKKGALADAVAEFAIYCQVRSQLFPAASFNEPDAIAPLERVIH